MISHDRAQELISARMDAPLTPAEHRELQGHLATCQACRIFVTQADELARGLQVMPRLAASPAVSRAVMSAVSAEGSGWSWLQRGLQALSSPGLAVASAAALVVALTGALMLALNTPDAGLGTEPEGTIAALAQPPIPTEIPTAAPTEPPAPEPTATSAPTRTIKSAATERPARTPTPRPTTTSVPIIAAADTQSEPGLASDTVGGESPLIEQVSGADAPELAMAGDESGDTAASADLAQDAVVEAPAESGGEAAAPVDSGEGTSGEIDAAAVEDDSGRKDGRKDGGDKGKDQAAAPAAEPEAPVPTHEIAPVIIPREAIDAMEAAGTAPEDYLPPPPVDPMMPPQDFLPVTPTPEGDGTPTPEAPTQSDAPQLAEEWSDELGVTALAPEPPPDANVVAEPAPVIVEDEEKIKDRGKRDKESRDGKSHEAEQAAYVAEPMGWMAEGSELAQVLTEPVTLAQTAETPVPAETTGASETATTDTTAATGTEQPRQIDPATGLEIDPVSGLLIDPTTGYLIDIANGRIIDPRTGYLVDPMTGLLEDPATGALLDPNTLAVVIPAGFGDDTPDYNPSDPNMRGTIEGVVDDNYDNATYKVIPPTDGPVQPVDEIVVPTESGEAVEIQ